MEITSAQNPRFKNALQLLERKGRRRQGLFLAEGERACDRALAAGLALQEIWWCPELAPELPEPFQLSDTPPVITTETLLKKLSYLSQPEGFVASFTSPDFSLAQLEAGKRTLVIVGTEKPGNLGAMARTAKAAGFDALIAAGAPIDPLNPNAIRASTGAVFDLAIACCSEEDAQQWLLEHRIPTYAAYVDADAKTHLQTQWPDQCAIVIGPEDTGLNQSWRTTCGDTNGHGVYIPQAAGSVDSLNASVAAGILCYAAAAL